MEFALWLKDEARRISKQSFSMSMFVHINSKLAIVAIGSVTAEALVEMDIKVDVTPEKHMFEGISCIGWVLERQLSSHFIDQRVSIFCLINH
jgi:hypothetical protein